MSRSFACPSAPARQHAATRPRALVPGLALALATTLTVACSDQPTTPSTASDTPALAAAPSGGNGATVVRGDLTFGVAGGGDPRDNLAFSVGPLDPVAAAQAWCLDPNAILPDSPGARSQFVAMPNGRVNLHAVTQEAHIAVWQFTGTVVSYCQLMSAPVVATGVVTYRVQNGNALAYIGAGGPGAAPWLISAVGTVDLTSGGQAHLEVTARLLLAPDGTLVMDEERVSLTPL